MRNTKLILILSMLIILVGLVTTKVLANSLPIITRVCESKFGNLISINDGFSMFKKCPTGSREVLIIGQPGPQGNSGEIGLIGPKGDKGDPGFSTDKMVHVCFNVANGSIRVLQASTCGNDVHWQIPVNCVNGTPCKPDNINDLYYLNNN